MQLSVAAARQCRWFLVECTSGCMVLVLQGPPTLYLCFSTWPARGSRTWQRCKKAGCCLSDIALHDMTSDYILLAEQRHAEADLKERYERLTLELKVGHA